MLGAPMLLSTDPFHFPICIGMCMLLHEVPMTTLFRLLTALQLDSGCYLLLQLPNIWATLRFAHRVVLNASVLPPCSIKEVEPVNFLVQLTTKSTDLLDEESEWEHRYCATDEDGG